MSVELFRSDPGYLSFAFPIGSERVVTWQSFAIAVGGGLVAAVFGVLAPLRGNVFSHIALGDAGRRRARSVDRKGGAVRVGVSSGHDRNPAARAAGGNSRGPEPDGRTAAAPARAARPRRHRARPPAARHSRCGFVSGGDRAALVVQSIAVDRDRRHRCDRGVRQRRHSGSPPGSAKRSRSGRARAQRGDRAVGVARGRRQRTHDDSLSRCCCRYARAAVRRSRCGHLSRLVPGSRRTTRVGARISPRRFAAYDLAQSGGAGQCSTGGCPHSSRRLGGALAGDRRGTEAASGSIVHLALATADEFPGRGHYHQFRMAAGRGRPQRRRLRARMVERGSKCLSGPTPAGGLRTGCRPRDRTCAGITLGSHGRDIDRSRTELPRHESSGARASDPDLDTGADRGGPGDGGGDGGDDLATPSTARRHEGGRV